MSSVQKTLRVSAIFATAIFAAASFAAAADAPPRRPTTR